MKKENLLSKSEMKKVNGGGGGLPCVDNWTLCGITGDADLVYVDVCCETLAEAESTCRGLGYTGTFSCQLKA